MPGSPADLSYAGFTLADRYRVEEPLAQGALSQVFRGQDAVLRRGVAIKVVPPEHVIAFQAALHATATLTHPAVIAVFDAIEHEGCFYIVQEHVQARAFSSYLQAGLPAERATDLASQMARALAYAHAHDIVHGDLTPAAVLVDRRAVLRLNNFALPPDTAYFDTYARALEPAETTLVAGATGAQPASYAEDVRAVGLILWQALSTAHPADAVPDDAEDAQRAFRRDVPEEARALVRRCVVRSHPSRIADAETLTLELEALAEALARLRSPLAEETPAALRVAREMIRHEAPWSLEDTVGAAQPWATSDEALAQVNSSSLGGATAPAVFAPVSSYPSLPDAPFSGPLVAPRLSLPSRPLPSMPRGGEPYLASPDATHASTAGGGPSLILVLLLGTVLFVVCFLIGFFILQ
jgi:serine/threonine protein kinase